MGPLSASEARPLAQMSHMIKIPQMMHGSVLAAILYGLGLAGITAGCRDRGAYV